MAALMQPLGGQRLVYLTPIGGFNFIFRVSLYFGIGVILPVIIYHLYRFLEPLMDKRHKKSVLGYIVASILLAITGGCFAYFGSLPAAMHFLTSFNIQNVSAMLTVDSYLSFVITYVLGFAALFQIPLILLIINSIKPIPPKKLLSFQRFVILGAFILAAIISPTPDITNQTILAVPIILMYEIGVLLVWLQDRSKKKREPAQVRFASRPTPQPVRRVFTERPHVTAPQSTIAASARVTTRPATQPRPVIDVAAGRIRTGRPMPTVHSTRLDSIRRAPAGRPAVTRPQPRITSSRPSSIDGMLPRTQPQAG